MTDAYGNVEVFAEGGLEKCIAQVILTILTHYTSNDSIFAQNIFLVDIHLPFPFSVDFNHVILRDDGTVKLGEDFNDALHT